MVIMLNLAPFYTVPGFFAHGRDFDDAYFGHLVNPVALCSSDGHATAPEVACNYESRSNYIICRVCLISD